MNGLPDADGLFGVLERSGAPRCMLLCDVPTGLRAVLVLDDLTLGPGAGGVRTRNYPSLNAAAEDCMRLARAMTIKCALGGLDAGGAKLVVMEHPELDRPGAFARLGQLVQELGGLFRTAGDLGTTAADLAKMAETCRYVHTDETRLADAVARGLLRCIEACAEVSGTRVERLTVAVQGAGVIGEAVTRGLVAAGARVVLADIDSVRARRVASECGAEVVDARDVLSTPVDVLSPCAVGGVLGVRQVDALRAWAVCGAANNILADSAAGQRLVERGVLFVPDTIASGGAVIDGIARSVMGVADPSELIDGLGTTALAILRLGVDTRIPTSSLAEARAIARIENARQLKARRDP